MANTKKSAKSAKDSKKNSVKACTPATVSNAVANANKLAELLKSAKEFVNEQASVKENSVVIFTAHEFLTVAPCEKRTNKNGGLLLKWNGTRNEVLSNLKAVAAEYGVKVLGTYQQASSCARRLYLVENVNKVSAFTLHELNCMQDTDGNRYDNQEQTTDFSSSSPRFAAAMAAGTVSSLDEEYKEYHDSEKAKRLQQYINR